VALRGASRHRTYHAARQRITPHAYKLLHGKPNGSDSPHRRRLIDRSIVFARWRPYVLPSNTWFLEPTRVRRHSLLP